MWHSVLLRIRPSSALPRLDVQDKEIALPLSLRIMPTFTPLLPDKIAKGCYSKSAEKLLCTNCLILPGGVDLSILGHHDDDKSPRRCRIAVAALCLLPSPPHAFFGVLSVCVVWKPRACVSVAAFTFTEYYIYVYDADFLSLRREESTYVFTEALFCFSFPVLPRSSVNVLGKLTHTRTYV